MKARRVTYRVRQFFSAARSQPSSVDLGLAQTILTPAQMALFSRMQPAEQAHSLQVAGALLAVGEQDPDLMLAALLHDVGKICQPLSLWGRVWIVLGQALFPSLARRWEAAPAEGETVSFLRRPFVTAGQHPQWGAELARRAGASETAVELIRRHQVRLDQDSANFTALDRLSGLLQSVDDES